MKKQATFQFFAELNDFLIHDQKEKAIVCAFRGRQSVKHLIESLRIPHTEVGKVVVNGATVDFSYLVQNEDRIQVYPATPAERLNSNAGPLDSWGEPLHFLLDNHLGKLAIYLRILGFDTLYRNDYQDKELAYIASRDNRVLLTRDRGLLMRREVVFGYCIRSLNPKQQVAEVLNRFELFDKIRPFRRCLRCNRLLRPVEKQFVLERLEPLTRRYYAEFYICDACNQIYWKGSHYEHMQKFLEKIMEKE